MSTLREAAEEALRWMEHARLHLTIKERMHPDGLSLYDSATEALRSALAQPKTELRDQHKAFTHWYFGLRGINEANFSPEDLAWAAWKAALAQPEAEPEPVAWLNRYRAAIVTQDRETANAMGFTTPLYAHPPRDEWRPASEPPEDGRRVLIWVAKSGGETFRPAYCPAGGWTSVFDGETLVAWRDVTPPGSDNIHNIRPLYAHPPRDEWRLASEPPEDDRSVLVWMPGKLGGLAIGRCSRGNWSPYYLGSPVTHWRDVTPPTEGAR